MTTFHVAVTGADSADGSAAHPFRSINHAAQVACAGDTVTVHAGTYREWVDPKRGGLGEQRRITYAAAAGEAVKISGAEVVTGWQRVEGSVWRAQVPNALFGGFNPFAEPLRGDWLVIPRGTPAPHLGDVYLNGRSLYESASLAAVVAAAVTEHAVDHWTGVTVPAHDPDGTRYRWYAEVEEDTTSIWANFHEHDPNAELVEISVRRSVFVPSRHHINYVTVRGFELAQAATPWAPPTADQPGLIGPNWAKGWVIEDNWIHDAKCAAVSLGKEGSTGDNYSTERGDKPGYQYQLESVFSARQIGWDKEHIGSHVVRRNEISHSGQNAIVGHLGCVFSTIADNHIHHIAVKREFYGYEIAGIKLHAAIDVQIRRNRIHDCTLGIWLDWQTQGTRIARNVSYFNNRDLFIEVSHGPCLVDHNVFASPAGIEQFSQGCAFVHNLVAGTLRLEPVLDRATPYHVPHSTQVAGYAIIRGGDDRVIGNVFLAGDGARAYGEAAEGDAAAHYGTGGYDGHPDSFAGYLERIAAEPDGDHQRFAPVLQPVYIRDNVYASGATAYAAEAGATRLPAAVTARVHEFDDEVYLEIAPAVFAAGPGLSPVTGADLPRVRFANAEFETPTGEPVSVDVDLGGAHKLAGERYPAGPFAAPEFSDGRIRLW